MYKGQLEETTKQEIRFRNLCPGFHQSALCTKHLAITSIHIQQITITTSFILGFQGTFTRADLQPNLFLTVHYYTDAQIIPRNFHTCSIRSVFLPVVARYLAAELPSTPAPTTQTSKTVSMSRLVLQHSLTERDQGKYSGAVRHSHFSHRLIGIRGLLSPMSAT